MKTFAHVINCRMAPAAVAATWGAFYSFFYRRRKVKEDQNVKTYQEEKEVITVPAISPPPGWNGTWTDQEKYQQQ